jgi:predicted nuclease with RNAse H fold
VPAVVGVDLAAGRGTTEVAALLLRPGDRPIFLVAHHRAVVTDADIVAAVADACPSVVAIDAPLSLPRPVHAAVLGETYDGPSASPYTRAAERDVLWSQLGIRPLPVSFLGGLTFRAIVLLPGLRAALPATALIEAFPSGTLAALGISRVTSGTSKRGKATADVRRTVQQGLSRWIAGLPNPSDMLLSADLLDALAAALTAAAYSSGSYCTAGDPAEGQIVVPALS